MRVRGGSSSVLLATILLVVTAQSTVAADRNDPACPGVRPGAVMYPEKNQMYETSWNFIVWGSDGATYSLTDGYAIGTRPQFEVGTQTGVRVEKKWKPGAGPGVTDGSRKVVGRAVWFMQEGSEQFTLIRLNRGQRWASAVCAFGQPTSIDLTIDETPTLISIYGQGNDRTAREQTDVLPYGRFDVDWVSKTIPVSSGDWGAPVLSGDNQALGFLGHQAGLNGPDASHVWTGGQVFRLTPLMQRSSRALGITLSLEPRPAGVAR